MPDSSDKNLKTHDTEPSSDALELERRRKTMRRILAGGGLIAGSQALPEKWAKPVIDSVILPAHAAASPGVTTTTGPTTVAPTTTPDCSTYGVYYHWDGKTCIYDGPP